MFQIINYSFKFRNKPRDFYMKWNRQRYYNINDSMYDRSQKKKTQYVRQRMNGIYTYIICGSYITGILHVENWAYNICVGIYMWRYHKAYLCLSFLLFSPRLNYQINIGTKPLTRQWTRHIMSQIYLSSLSDLYLSFSFLFLFLYIIFLPNLQRYAFKTS